jgi:hypothetical protein
VKRNLKTLALLVVSLFIVVSGVNAALDKQADSVTQNSFTVYNEQGNVIFAYQGDLNACRAFTKPCPVAAPTFLHRT